MLRSSTALYALSTEIHIIAGSSCSYHSKSLLSSLLLIRKTHSRALQRSFDMFRASQKVQRKVICIIYIFSRFVFFVDVLRSIWCCWLMNIGHIYVTCSALLAQALKFPTAAVAQLDNQLPSSIRCMLTSASAALEGGVLPEPLQMLTSLSLTVHRLGARFSFFGPSGAGFWWMGGGGFPRWLQMLKVPLNDCPG